MPSSNNRKLHFLAILNDNNSYGVLLNDDNINKNIYKHIEILLLSHV